MKERCHINLRRTLYHGDNVTTLISYLDEVKILLTGATRCTICGFTVWIEEIIGRQFLNNF